MNTNQTKGGESPFHRVVGLRFLATLSENDPRRCWSYVIGEGPIDTVYEDALFLAEKGDLRAFSGALCELSRRHHECARALAHATGTPIDESPTFHLRERADV